MKSDRALLHLRLIRDYIASDSELQAQAQIKRIIQKVEWLASKPVRSHPVNEFPTTGWLDAHEGSYRIIHRFVGDELRVGVVVHDKQLLRRSWLR